MSLPLIDRPRLTQVQIRARRTAIGDIAHALVFGLICGGVVLYLLAPERTKR